MKRASSLARVSDPKQKDNFSIEAQHDSNVKLGEERGIHVVKFFDEQASGGGMRKTVQEAYDWHKKRYNSTTRKNSVPYLLVDDWSRWFRDVNLSGHWIINFREIGVEVNASKKWIDANSKTDVLIHSIEQGLAHVRRLEIRHDTIRSQYMARVKGCIIGRAPRGLIYHPKQKDRLSYLSSDPVLGPKYGQAFSLVGSGVPKKTTWRQLGGREVFGAYTSFCDALENPAYAGKKYVEATLPGQVSQWVDLRFDGDPPTDWLTFQRVQGREMQYEAHKDTTLDLYPAKLVLRCASCGRASTNERVVKPNGNTFEYYRLNCKCGGKQVRYDRRTMNDFAARTIDRLALSAAAYEYAQELVERQIGEMRKDMGVKISVLSKAVNDAKELKANALKLFVSKKIGEDEYSMFSDDLVKAEAELEKAIYVRDNNSDVQLQVLQFLGNIGGLYDNLSGADQALVLKAVFPDGFSVTTKTPKSIIRNCRTTRINSVFGISPSLTELYKSVKIEAGLFGVNNPAKGDKPDRIRTMDISLLERVCGVLFNQNRVA